MEGGEVRDGPGRRKEGEMECGKGMRYSDGLGRRKVGK